MRVIHWYIANHDAGLGKACCIGSNRGFGCIAAISPCSSHDYLSAGMWKQLVAQFEPVEHGAQAHVERSLIDPLLARLPEVLTLAGRFVTACVKAARGEGDPDCEPHACVQEHGEEIAAEMPLEALAMTSAGATGVAVADTARWDSEGAREALRDRLPAHMIPERIVALSALPLNENGKLDRSELDAALRANRDVTPDPGAVPTTAVERRVAAVWGGVLGRAPASLADDFFRMGGHSDGPVDEAGWKRFGEIQQFGGNIES